MSVSTAVIAVNRDDHGAIGGGNASAWANQTGHLGAVLQIQQLRSAPGFTAIGALGQIKEGSASDLIRTVLEE